MSTKKLDESGQVFARSLAARRSLQVNHIDVKSAYLHGDLPETIYME